MKNKRILIMKLSPYNGLNSSTMRMLAMMSGLDLLGYSMDLLTIPLSVSSVEMNMEDYSFLERVNIIFTKPNSVYQAAFSQKSVLRALKPTLRKIYHRLFQGDQTNAIAKTVKIDMLPTKEYDYIIAVSDPKSTYDALLNLLNQGLKTSSIIEYWGDPLAIDMTNKSITPKFILKNRERKFLRIADRIIYTNPFTLEAQKQLYPEFAERMIYTPTANPREKLYPNKKQDPFVVGYYGAYTSTVRNIMPLYKAAVKLSDVKTYIVGDSDISLTSTESVEIRKRSNVQKLEENTDLFVCVLNLSGTQIPGKIYHLAATNKPILVILDGERKEDIKKYLEGFNRYIMCENEEKAIINAINEVRKSKSTYQPLTALKAENVAKKIIGLK